MIGPVPGEGERGAVLPGGQNRPSEQDDRRQMQAEAGRAAPIRGGRPPEPAYERRRTQARLTVLSLSRLGDYR